MIIAQVVGNIVATQKNVRYDNTKLLMVQQLDLEGNPKGEPLIAVDGVQAHAGVGDKVLVVQEGWSAGYAIRREVSPIDAAVVGVIDNIEFLSQA